MSTSVKFLKGEAGQQAAFGTAVSPTIDLPFTGRYVDEQEDHEAEYDAGVWIDSKIRTKVNDFATFTLEGSAFYEMIPLFLNAGYNHVAATDEGGGLFSYDDEIDLAAAGTPRPWTFRFGGGEDIGGTGPAIQIADAYCQSLTLSGGVNQKAVSLRSSWFGKSVDDNSAAGYAFAASALPANLALIRAMGNTFKMKDAGTTGGSFTGMTATTCKLLSWELTINFGTQPKWGSDSSSYNYCGVFFENPMIEFKPVFRLDSATYGLIRTKYDARTYQELEFGLVGPGSRQWLLQQTGIWRDVPTAHDRDNNEVVLKPTWKVERYGAQTTTPHLFSWQLDTLNELYS